MRWLMRWFFRRYLLALAAQGGAPLTLFAIFGFSSQVDRFLSQNRIAVGLVLLVHFMCYLISELATADTYRLQEFRRKHLGDEDD